MVEVRCVHCGSFFEAADSLAGGLTNCPACGRATDVPGLRDRFFRAIQIGMAAAWALLTAIGWSAGGWAGAIGVGVGAALVIVLLYIAL
jgi:hypothetical protein